MEVPRTRRPVRVSSPCGTLEEDEGHSRSRAEEGVYVQCVLAGGRVGAGAGGGKNIYWRQMDTGRVPDGRARASPQTADADLCC